MRVKKRRLGKRSRNSKFAEAHWGLIGLADFLNTARPGATQTDWLAFMERTKDTSFGDYFVSWVSTITEPEALARKVPRMNLAEAIDVRSEMHGALGFLRATPEQLQRENQPYLGITYQLQELKMPTGYRCSEIKGDRKPWPGQNVLHSGDGRRWVTTPWPIARNTKELLYTVLAGALMYGTLNRLKACEECQKYMVVKDLKRRFCEGNKCKDAYFNRRKLQDGTFQTARRKRRLLSAE